MMRICSSFLASAVTLCLYAYAQESVSNGVLVKKVAMPETITKSLTVTRVINMGNRVAYFGADEHKTPYVLVKNPDGKFNAVKDVPKCAIQEFVSSSQQAILFLMRHFQISAESIYIGCSSAALDPNTTRVFRTSADWDRFSEILSVGSAITYSPASSQFSGQGTVQKIYSGVFPGGNVYLEVKEGSKTNAGIFRIDAEGKWRQVMSQPSEIFAISPDTPVWSNGENYYFRGQDRQNRYIIYKWDNELKQLSVLIKDGDSFLDESVNQVNLIMVNGSGMLWYSPPGQTDNKRLVSLEGFNKILHPSTFQGRYPFATYGVNLVNGFGTIVSQRSSSDRRFSDLTVWENQSPRNLISVESLTALGIAGLGNTSWVYNDGVEFMSIAYPVYKIVDWYRAIWPIVDDVLQKDEELTITGKNLVMYPDGSDQAYVTQVVIGGQRVTPKTATANKVVLDIPTGMSGNAPLQVLILHPGGEVKSQEQRVELQVIVPKAELKAEKLTVKRNETVKLKWETTGADYVTINDEPVPLDGEKEVAMFESSVFVLKAFGPGGETSTEIRIVVLVPPPTISEITGDFVPGGKLRISGSELFGPSFTVRVALADQSGEDAGELAIESAAADYIDGYLPDTLLPGVYKIWVERLDESGPQTSDPVEITVNNKASDGEKGYDASNGPKGWRK